MPATTVFSKSVCQTKKKNKIKILFLVLGRIIKNNPNLFIFCSLLAVISSVINFNIAFNLKSAFKIEGGNIFDKKNFSFAFNFFGFYWFKNSNLDIWGFLWRLLALIFVVKSLFSLLHYYWSSYAYDRVEKDLKKDLFHHFIWAKYPHAAQVSRNLITQFSSDLDNIANNIWFIPNRLLYVITSIFFLVIFDFAHGSGKINWNFLVIVMALFSILIFAEIILFKKAVKLNIAAKKRYEEDNKVIYERINNLEYIKASSGEKYEEEKISQQLDSTFRKNKKALWYSVLFKALPNYLIIPNIPIFFAALVLALASPIEKGQDIFLVVNFVMYFDTVRRLNNEVSKIIESLVNLDDLSSNLTIVNESVKILNKKDEPSLPKKVIHPFINGDITFQKVVFAYPQRPQQDILRNFNFTFCQGKIYGIAGKNGIGKSTITKTLLKLYDLKEGEILIAGQNIQEIDSKSLHQRICYQTNRPSFFHLSIAENVFYPYKYQPADLPKLKQAAKKVGIAEFIERLPHGFQTKLREGGTDLSEGQKQQIAAIRIFIRNYDIYILDEILSNVHPDLKEVVLRNIFQHLSNKTVLVIDHHYEIFQHVDYVYQFTGEKLIEKKKQDFII